ncbi:hypothetical protein [Verrucomicrobium sp. BvORR034]|uniref:hypothetical protein n=1 Tax=Verrucomicrobium sp. BvORR034 TaxID=1396418 RepID=UPI00067915C4|nr:hypothetical protein [Verrucomicrobium sp. BvORR034]
MNMGTGVGMAMVVDITIMMMTMTMTIIIMARAGTVIGIGTVVPGAIDHLAMRSSSTKPPEHQVAVLDVSQTL